MYLQVMNILYVCSQYNDAFGFFISGPFDENGNFVNIGGITPYINENIAIIPGSDPELPVTINTVNGGSTMCVQFPSTYSANFRFFN